MQVLVSSTMLRLDESEASKEAQARAAELAQVALDGGSYANVFDLARTCVMLGLIYGQGGPDKCAWVNRHRYQ